MFFQKLLVHYFMILLGNLLFEEDEINNEDVLFLIGYSYFCLIFNNASRINEGS